MWARGCVSRCEFLKSLLLKLMVYPQGGELGNNQCLGDFVAVETPPRMPLWPVQSNEQAERREGRTSNMRGENLVSLMGKANRRSHPNYHQSRG